MGELPRRNSAECWPEHSRYCVGDIVLSGPGPEVLISAGRSGDFKYGRRVYGAKLSKLNGGSGTQRKDGSGTAANMCSTMSNDVAHIQK